MDSIKTNIIVISGKKEDLINSTNIWSSKVLAFEEDTGRCKRCDGSRLYRQLEYKTGFTLSDEMFDMFKNVNESNGLVQLDKDGNIPIELFPTEACTTTDMIVISGGDASTAQQLYDDYIKSKSK